MRTIVAEKAIIVAATERKRKVNASVNFLGRDLWKSWSRNGEVRMEMNMTTEVRELTSERTSMNVKTMKKGL